MNIRKVMKCMSFGALYQLAAPAWAGLIEKQGKGVFFFNVGVALLIVGIGGYIMWKKKQAEEGDDE